MTHLFYITTAVLALFELMKMFKCRTLFHEDRTVRRMNKKDRKMYLEYNPDYEALSIAERAEFIFCFIGLASSQWFAFAFVILIAFSKFNRLGSWALAIDNLLCASAFMLVVINKYYL